jgi:uncharacterized protein YcbK (DUF882 family)
MNPDEFCMWRRRLLVAAGCAAVAPAFAAPPPASAASEAMKELLSERRSIWLVRGGEQLQATYWSAERGYDRDQYLQLCWAMRDLQADRVFPMDHGLLDVLAALQVWLAKSGYVLRWSCTRGTARARPTRSSKAPRSIHGTCSARRPTSPYPA